MLHSDEQHDRTSAMPRASFLGAIVEDTGVGAYGTLQFQHLGLAIPEQRHIGVYGVLSLNSQGSWRYILHEMESLSLGLIEGKPSAELIAIQMFEESNLSRLFNLKLEIFGTEDIPDIRGASIIQGLLNERQTAELTTTGAERPVSDPLFNMIEAYLNNP